MRRASTQRTTKSVEQAPATAQQDKEGVMQVVGRQQRGGGVTRLEPGQWVGLRHPQYGRIIVRIDRIKALVVP
jgi:hypothetical protein